MLVVGHHTRTSRTPFGVGKGPAMVYVSAVVLTVLSPVFWVSILFNLSGTWLMVLVTGVLKWWLPGQPTPGPIRVADFFGVAFGSADPLAPTLLSSQP
jgi:hypothetical protein